MKKSKGRGRPPKDESDCLTYPVTIYMTAEQKLKWQARVRATDYFCKTGGELGRRLLLEGELKR